MQKLNCSFVCSCKHQQQQLVGCPICSSSCWPELSSWAANQAKVQNLQHVISLSDDPVKSWSLRVELLFATPSFVLSKFGCAQICCLFIVNKSNQDERCKFPCTTWTSRFVCLHQTSVIHSFIQATDRQASQLNWPVSTWLLPRSTTHNLQSIICLCLSTVR